jgi:hypothetical protein
MAYTLAPAVVTEEAVHYEPFWNNTSEPNFSLHTPQSRSW